MKDSNTPFSPFDASNTNSDKHRGAIYIDQLIWIPDYSGNSEHYDVVQKHINTQILWEYKKIIQVEVAVCRVFFDKTTVAF